MISIQNRGEIVKLIKETHEFGARINRCCNVVEISIRTYERWVSDGDVKSDQRPLVERPEPNNKLTDEEYKAVIRIANLPEYADLPPSQIVPLIADRGMYLASESTFYRILRNEGM